MSNVMLEGSAVPSPEPYSVEKLTAEARRLAAEYRRATGKTLPLSGEIAVNDAIRLLQLELPKVPSSAYDAVRRHAGGVAKVQIKGRVVFQAGKGSPRIGQLKLEQAWDETLLVLMNEDYEPLEIFRAEHMKIEEALANKSSNKRGAMTIAQFKIIGDCVWSAPDPAAQQE